MEMLNFAWHNFCNSKIDRIYLKLKRLLFHLGKDKYPRKCWAIKTILRYKLHPELIILIHCQKHLPSLLASSSRNNSCCWNLPWRLLGSPRGKALHWRPISINNNSNFILCDKFFTMMQKIGSYFSDVSADGNLSKYPVTTHLWRQILVSCDSALMEVPCPLLLQLST